MYNRLFSHIVILLLSLIINHSVFAVEARYVKILIDRTTDSTFCNGLISISDLRIFDYSGANLVTSSTVFVSAASVALFPPSGSFSSSCRFGSVPNFAIDSDLMTAYATPDGSGLTPIGSQWLMIDLKTITNIDKVTLSTLEGWQSFFVYSPLVDYRIAVSIDGLDWTLAAVVVDQPGVSRTDTVTLEDLGGGMDIDIWLIFTLILAITVFAFYRQIFF